MLGAGVRPAGGETLLSATSQGTKGLAGVWVYMLSLSPGTPSCHFHLGNSSGCSVGVTSVTSPCTPISGDLTRRGPVWGVGSSRAESPSLADLGSQRSLWTAERWDSWLWTSHRGGSSRRGILRSLADPKLCRTTAGEQTLQWLSWQGVSFESES